VKTVEAIMKPFKLEAVQEKLSASGMQDMTVSEVREFGRQVSEETEIEGLDAPEIGVLGYLEVRQSGCVFMILTGTWCPYPMKPNGQRTESLEAEVARLRARLAQFEGTASASC
jgi:hypothetical protein